MRMRTIALAFLLMFALSGGSASAGPITADGTWYQFVFNAGGAGTGCFGGCLSTLNPVATDALAPPWTFSGDATVTVLDLFIQGDTFELFDNLVSLGVSSVPGDDNTCANNIGCALADPDYSRLVVALGAGPHSLTISNLSSAIPSGGAAVFQVAPSTVTSPNPIPSAVPEPASLLLVASGVAGCAARLRFRRRKKPQGTSPTRV